MRRGRKFTIVGTRFEQDNNAESGARSDRQSTIDKSTRPSHSYWRQLALVGSQCVTIPPHYRNMLSKILHSYHRYWKHAMLVAFALASAHCDCASAATRIGAGHQNGRGIGSSSPQNLRFLSEQQVAGGAPENIFNKVKRGDDNDNTTEKECVRPDQYGDFGVEAPYNDAVVVAWTYQVQGVLEMTASRVVAHVVPAIEARLATMLLETLFNATECEEDGQSGRGDRRRRNLFQLEHLELDNGSQVTGMLREPRDMIRNGHDGGRFTNMHKLKAPNLSYSCHVCAVWKSDAIFNCQSFAKTTLSLKMLLDASD